MANAAHIHVYDLTANGFTAEPTGDVCDTGLVPVTLYTDGAIGPTDRVILKCVNNDAGFATDFTILAGDNPPAQRAGIGNVTKAAAASATWYFGPFESARFIQNDGTLGITVSPTATKTIAAAITLLRLPAAV